MCRKRVWREAKMRWWRGRGSRSRSAVSPEGGAPFILALKDGKTIGEAAILALRESSAFDLKANLAGLMASGAIVAVGAAASD